MSEKDYPPLPEPGDIDRWVSSADGKWSRRQHGYTADQMHAYLAADRAQRAQPAITEAQVDEYLAGYVTEYDNGSYTPDDEERFRIKDAIMGLLAAPTPAQVPAQPEAGKWVSEPTDKMLLALHTEIERITGRIFHEALGPALKAALAAAPQPSAAQPAGQDVPPIPLAVATTEAALLDCVRGGQNEDEARTTHRIAIRDYARACLSAAPPLEQGQAALRERCDCRRCIRERGDTLGGLPRLLGEMIICRSCGDKRCVHAEHHEAPCAKADIYAHNAWVEAALATPTQATQPDADLTAAYMAGFERGKDAAKPDALDARRYRWLRQGDGKPPPVGIDWPVITMHESDETVWEAEADAAIDAAMAQTSKPKA